MQKGLKVTFLGSGSAVGVPLMGCECSVCLSKDRANKRTRTAFLLKREAKTYLLDPGPDIRQQLLDYPIKKIDAVLITHCHYDHIGGFDDLRVWAIKQKSPIPVLIHTKNQDELLRRCGYLFREGAHYFQITSLQDEQGLLTFEGLPIRYFTYLQNGMNVTGFVVNQVAFASDIQNLDEPLVANLKDVGTLIVSCHVKPRPEFKSHLYLEEVEALKAMTGASQLILTHLGHDADYKTLCEKVDEDMWVSYDGFSFEVD